MLSVLILYSFGFGGAYDGRRNPACVKMCVIYVHTLQVAFRDLIGHVHAVLQLVLSQCFSWRPLMRKKSRRDYNEEMEKQTFT